jgi:regulator of sigma E protease
MIASLALALPLGGIGKVLIFLVVLSILVVLHEYGHFLLARRNGVRVNDFAVGMGPTLLKWTSPRSGTNYRVNLLPIGGYCAMKGEDGKTSEAEQQREFRAGQHDEDNFQAKSPLQRLAIVVAGPVANFIVALALLFFGATLFGIPGDVPSTRIAQLIPGYPAERAGMRFGDSIVDIDGTAITNGNQLVSLIHDSIGKRLHVTYERGGVTHAVDVTPRKDIVAGKAVGRLGFAPADVLHRVGPIEAARVSWLEFSGVLTGTVGVLGQLFVHPALVAQLHGAVGMAQASATIQDFGLGIYLPFAAQISISLGIFNLLPIPALDGGRGIFILVEMLRGKPVDPEKEALVHFGGFALLMLLIIFISFHDIQNIVAGKGVF